MKEKVVLNRKDFDEIATSITNLLDYIESSLGHASHMIGSFMNFDFADNGDITSDFSLNKEALDELIFQSKKISSKADTMQSKVAQLKKIIDQHT